MLYIVGISASSVSESVYRVILPIDLTGGDIIHRTDRGELDMFHSGQVRYLRRFLAEHARAGSVNDVIILTVTLDKVSMNRTQGKDDV